MKSILINQKPKQVANILNGKQTIVILKQFPKDYCGWVYIYCSKEKPRAILTDKGCVVANTLKVGGNSQYKSGYSLSSKVVACFYCNKVEKITPQIWTPKLEHEILKKSYLTEFELFEYICSNNGTKDKPFCAIHISKLEIFDMPRELNEFEHETKTRDTVRGYIYDIKPVSKAPSTYCYVEVENEIH